MNTTPTDRHDTDIFRYQGIVVYEAEGAVEGTWRIGEDVFVERFVFPGDHDWTSVHVKEAVKWLYLLSGISYYKTRAPRVIDLGGISLSSDELSFLRRYYSEGLGEFAVRHDLAAADDAPSISQRIRNIEFQGYEPRDNTQVEERQITRQKPLLPFGGGVDSITSMQMLRESGIEPDLFIVSRGDSRMSAVDDPADASGLNIIRAERYMDEKVFRSAELGYLNGHVPVTGIISMMAILAAALHGNDAVIMSNEHSASDPTIIDRYGVPVNHQYSKSYAFETDLNAISQRAIGVDYFSLLRPRSGLWIAEYFAVHAREYFSTFCSCNRAFILDPARRSDGWCGECDKCAFVDLILAPYLARDELERIFRYHEPLQNTALRKVFQGLVGLDGVKKPWECVGDIGESQIALGLAAARPDRTDDLMLQELAADAPKTSLTDTVGVNAAHHIPRRYATAALLD